MPDRFAAAVVVENFAMGGIGDPNRRRAIDARVGGWARLVRDEN